MIVLLKYIFYLASVTHSDLNAGFDLPFHIRFLQLLLMGCQVHGLSLLSGIPLFLVIRWILYRPERDILLHRWKKCVLVRTLEVVGNRSVNLLTVEGKSIRRILRSHCGVLGRAELC